MRLTFPIGDRGPVSWCIESSVPRVEVTRASTRMAPSGVAAKLACSSSQPKQLSRPSMTMPSGGRM